jgi:hypothetical protein
VGERNPDGATMARSGFSFLPDANRNFEMQGGSGLEGELHEFEALSRDNFFTQVTTYQIFILDKKLWHALSKGQDDRQN